MRVAGPRRPGRAGGQDRTPACPPRAAAPGLGLPPADADEMLASLLAVADGVLAYARPAWADAGRRGAPGPAHPVRGRARGPARRRPRDLSLCHLVQHRGRPGGRRVGHGAPGAGLCAGDRQGLHHPRRRGGRSPPSSTTRSAGTSPPVGKEVGVNTGRQRRCGWFDAVLVRQSVAINGIQGVALTKLDILDGLESLKVCVGYRLDGAVLDYLPSGLKGAGGGRADLRDPGGLEPEHPGRAVMEGPAGQCGEIRPPCGGADRRPGGPALHQPPARRTPS